jgi:hypothetical protein
MHLETIHAHPRDKRIQLIEEERYNKKKNKTFKTHYYVIDGEIYKASVTSLLAEFCPNRFDAVVASRGDVSLQKLWKRNGKESAAFGTMHHQQFERYLDQPLELDSQTMLKNFKVDERYPMYQSYEELPVWSHFQTFLSSIPSYWQRYRVEWKVFSKEAKLPGTVDLVMRHVGYPDELVLMVVDYKINKEPQKIFCNCGKGVVRNANLHTDTCSAVFGNPLTRHMLDTKANKGSLQVAVYSTLLETLYGATVIEGKVVYMHPSEETAYTHTVDLQKLKPLATKMIASRMTK